MKMKKVGPGHSPLGSVSGLNVSYLVALFKLPSQYLDIQSSQKFSKWCSNLALQEREVLWQAFSTPLVKPGGPQLNTPTVRTLKLDFQLIFS